MNTVSDAKGLAEAIRRIFIEEPCVLFAGAGVSAQAGLPTWGGFIDVLAGVAEKYEPLVAALMRKRLKEGLLLEAAHLYKICVDIPEGERFNQLAEPFKKYEYRHLLPLAGLPFETVVTTNYDRSLHDAFGKTRSEAPRSVELNDPTLRESPYWKDFYIARIHGRAEVPRSIILDNDDYAKLYQDAAYSDFLHHLFTRKRCVFIGFSFLDPAIDRILQFIREKGVQPKKHIALLPSDAEPLTKKMSEFNIDVTAYSGGHVTLWEGIKQSGLSPTGAIVSESFLPPMFDLAKHLLAVCYARVSMGSEATALKEIVIEGILLSEISAGISTISALCNRLKQYLSLSESEAETLVRRGIASLVAKRKCLSEGDDVILIDKIEPSIKNSPVAPLVDGLIGRLALREKYEVKPDLRDALTKIVEEVIVLRGFDLGAEFSGATVGEDIDPLPTIVNAIERHLPKFWQNRQQQIAEVFIELVRMPDQKEEAILAHLGRISFGVELVLQAGRTTLYNLSLPEMVYLDASVVLPAIVTGHPLQAAYVNSLSKLQEASQKGGGTTALLFADVFLDEIIGHRRKAIDLVGKNNLEDETILERRILYFGADKVNVFIGAYSTWIKSSHTDKSFAAFLAEVAPYATHKELQDFLNSRGIAIASTITKTQADVLFANDVLTGLLDAYDAYEKGVSAVDQKPLVLKKHEASQLALMYKGISTGQRVLLVTADNRLRRVVGAQNQELRDVLVSPRNLLQLVDLLVGVEVDPSAVARLLWSVQAADERSLVKDYLIARALPHYNAALLLRMSDLLDKYVDRVLKEAKLEKVNLRATSTTQRLVTSRFMDRVETEIFTSLAEEVRKLEDRIKQLEKGDAKSGSSKSND